MLRVDAIDAAGYRERNDRFWREKPARWSSEQILSLFAEIRARNAFLMKKKKEKKHRRHRVYEIPVDYPATSTAKAR